jgi:hypothetical protein
MCAHSSSPDALGFGSVAVSIGSGTEDAMVLDRRWYIDLADRPCQPANSRVHLPGGSVTALARSQ